MASALLDRFTKPPVQAALFFAISVAFMLMTRALDQTGWYERDRLFCWSIATAFLLLFAIANSLMSLFSENFARYWGSAIYSYIGLAAANGLMAWLFSGIPIGEAQSYRWIYIVVTFGFLVFLSIVNLVKKIVQFAEKEEWNQPRPRR